MISASPISPRRCILQSKTVLTLALVVVVFLTGWTALSQDLSQAQEHSRAGLSLAREGKLTQAEQELREAVRMAPAVAVTYAQLASILGLQGKWKEALASFQKAIELDPTNINFRRETAAVQWQLRQMAAAEKNLRFVLAKRPDDSGAILLMGLVSEANGDYATAARLLESQFELVVSQPDRTVALFHSAVQSGQHSSLPKIIKTLRSRAPEAAWQNAITRCTEIAAVAGDLETSQSLFSLISSDQPSRLAAGFEVAKLHFNRGQIQTAEELLSQLAESAAKNADIQTLLGRCYQALHQPDLALRAYQRAIEIDPSQVARYEDLIFLQLEQDHASDATSAVNRLVSIAPDNANAWVMKAKVELLTNAFQDALKSYQHAGQLDRSSADAALGVAAIHALSGLSDAAISDYKAGIQRFPSDSRFYVAFAAALLASPDAPREYPRIRELLRQAVGLDPHSADARYQLGQVALKQGQLEEAETEFLAALKSDPDRSSTHFALSLIYRRTGRAEDAARHFALYEKLKQSEEREPAMAGQIGLKP